MGGGGKFYDRDVTDRTRRTAQGFSTDADRVLSRSQADSSSSPLNRHIACTGESAVALSLDGTGSMGRLPKILWDKFPMIAGQLVERAYLPNPTISLSIIGDIEGSTSGSRGDSAPIRVADFCQVRELDTWLQKLWLEGGGWGQARESYEFMAYFYARRCDISKAITSMMIFTGDEGFRDQLSGAELRKRFGGNHETISSSAAFKELRQKFSDNVFLVHPPYQDASEDKTIVKMWQGVLGKEHIVNLGTNEAIGDIILGIIALVGGTRDLSTYLNEMESREQTPERIAEVKRSLTELADFLKHRPKIRPHASNPEGSSADKPIDWK